MKEEDLRVCLSKIPISKKTIIEKLEEIGQDQLTTSEVMETIKEKDVQNVLMDMFNEIICSQQQYV